MTRPRQGNSDHANTPQNATTAEQREPPSLTACLTCLTCLDTGNAF
jgi:hypothetical protein